MRLFFFFLLLFNYLAGSNFLTELNSSLKTDGDSYNNYFYTEHFRIIIAKSAEDFYYNQIPKIEKTAEEIYNKEIKEYGFKTPLGADIYYIDVYFADIGTVNLETGEEAKNEWGDNQNTGEARIYDTVKASYIYLYPLAFKLDDTEFKSLFAHEFFHTIQFNYPNYTYWKWDPDAYKKDPGWKTVDLNRWFHESTPEFIGGFLAGYNGNIDTYFKKKFNLGISEYLKNMNKPLEENINGSEYGKVLIWIYLKQKYGIDKTVEFLKKTYAQYSEAERMTNFLNITSKETFNKSFGDIMADFGSWVYNSKNRYEYSSFLPVNSKEKNIGKYGMVFFDDGRYSAIDTNLYKMRDNLGNTNVISDKTVLFNPNDTELNSSIVLNNQADFITLSKGWNLIGNIYNVKIPMSDIDTLIIWVYRNGKFEAFSKYENISQVLQEYNLSLKDPYIYPGEGFFIYSLENKTLKLSTDTNELYTDSNFTLKAVKGYDDKTVKTYTNAGWYTTNKVKVFQAVYDKDLK